MAAPEPKPETRRIAREPKPAPNRIVAAKPAADTAVAEPAVVVKTPPKRAVAEKPIPTPVEKPAEKAPVEKVVVEPPPPPPKKVVVEPPPKVAGRGVAAKSTEPAGQRTVLFRTNPPGARVRLVSGTGAVIEASRANPSLFQVPAGVYSWEVELAGYLADRSGQKNRVDVSDKTADTVSLNLTPAGNVMSQLESGNSAFNEDRCPQAVAIYQNIERPGELASDVGRTWLASRGRMAQCQRKLHQLDNAIATYNVILAAEPFQWNAKYELGGTYCDKRDFRHGAETLREIGGAYLNNVPQDRRQAVQALAKYARGICQLKEYQSQAQPDSHPELRDPAVRSFDEFIFSAEKLLKDGVPEGIKGMLTRAYNDATTKKAELKSS